MDAEIWIPADRLVKSNCNKMSVTLTNSKGKFLSWSSAEDVAVCHSCQTLWRESWMRADSPHIQIEQYHFLLWRSRNICACQRLEEFEMLTGVQSLSSSKALLDRQAAGSFPIHNFDPNTLIESDACVIFVRLCESLRSSEDHLCFW